MKKYISIHSVAALEKREFSLVCANVDNTPEKLELAQSIYPEKEHWHIEQHDVKYDVTPVIFPR